MAKTAWPDRSFSRLSYRVSFHDGLIRLNLVMFWTVNSSRCCKISVLPLILPARADSMMVLPAPVAATAKVLLLVDRAFFALSTNFDWYSLRIIYLAHAGVDVVVCGVGAALKGLDGTDD